MSTIVNVPSGPAEVTAIIHARSLVFVGHAYSPWAGSGRRKYSERCLPNGQIELVCGLGLNDVHAASGGWPWAVLKSKRSREAKCVTCPECRRRLTAAGFIHASRP